jgi:flagellar hook-associated protein 1 FlgK
MGLSGVMTKALSGMRVTQAGLDVVSQNISNADSAGYVRRRANIIEQPLGQMSGGARDGGVNRLLDKVVQRQLWSETSGAGYTAARADSLTALDALFGPPDSGQSLGAVFGRFTQSLQQLQGDPSNFTLRANTVTTGQEMARRLNDLSAGVQDLRAQAELQIKDGVARVNQLLVEYAATNNSLANNNNQSSAASLRDQRDRLVTELSRYIDIRTAESPTGSMTLFTASGVTLFNGNSPAELSFDANPSMGPDRLWNANDALRGVGTIRITDATGVGYDLIAGNALRSGELAALVELRDRTLVEAQNQLDEFAAQMASALSDREIAGAAVAVGPATGFEVDIAGLAAGNTITLDYTDSTTGFQGRYTFVRADSAAAVARINQSGMSAGNNQIVGVDFTGFPGSMPAIAAQIQAAIGGGFTVSNAGSTLRIVDDGAGNTRDVRALAARPTAAGLTAAAPNGVPELAFFTDPFAPGGLYTGSFEATHPQARGLAARITVNAQIVADRSRLVQFETGPATPQGDPRRPALMLERLTQDSRFFSPQTGIGGNGVAFRSTVADFAQRIVESQGNVAEGAQRLDEGQQIALKAVEARFGETSGVNIDQEMANLVELQNAYAANARVISAVKEMMDLLMRI